MLLVMKYFMVRYRILEWPSGDKSTIATVNTRPLEQIIADKIFLFKHTSQFHHKTSTFSDTSVIGSIASLQVSAPKTVQ